jgi:hypothetical protein
MKFFKHLKWRFIPTNKIRKSKYRKVTLKKKARMPADLPLALQK